jgi:hypothetical protein
VEQRRVTHSPSICDSSQAMVASLFDCSTIPNGEIDILPAGKILIIGFQVEIAHAERDDLGPRLGGRPRPAYNAVAERIDRAPQVVHLNR